jgi:hypothetical protein
MLVSCGAGTFLWWAAASVLVGPVLNFLKAVLLNYKFRLNL